jgi:hypothetical protein
MIKEWLDRMLAASLRDALTREAVIRFVESERKSAMRQLTDLRRRKEDELAELQKKTSRLASELARLQREVRADVDCYKTDNVALWRVVERLRISANPIGWSYDDVLEWLEQERDDLTPDDVDDDLSHWVYDLERSQ